MQENRNAALYAPDDGDLLAKVKLLRDQSEPWATRRKHRVMCVFCVGMIVLMFLIWRLWPFNAFYKFGIIAVAVLASFRLIVFMYWKEPVPEKVVTLRADVGTLASLLGQRVCLQCFAVSNNRHFVRCPECHFRYR